jgi:hypothetical protein
MKTGKVDASASVAGIRIEYGVPHFRLAKIQEQKGMALPDSKQDRLIKQVAFSADPLSPYPYGFRTRTFAKR